MRDVYLVIRLTRYWIHYGFLTHIVVCTLVGAIEDGCSLKAAAAAFKVSPATAHRWWHRWQDAGPRKRMGQ